MLVIANTSGEIHLVFAALYIFSNAMIFPVTLAIGSVKNLNQLSEGENLNCSVSIIIWFSILMSYFLLYISSVEA